MSLKPDGQPSLGRDLRWSAIVFGVGLAVRLLFLFSSPDRNWPHSAYYEGDALYWAEWATKLDRGEPFEFGLPLRSPAVAYLMHWIPWEHTNFLAMKFLWCALSALSCALVFICARVMFNRLVAFTASGLTVFSFGQDVVATSLNNEALYTCALLTTMLATVALVCRPRWWIALIAGSLNGIAMLIRPEHPLLLVLVAGVLIVIWPGEARPSAKSRIGLTMLVLLSALLVTLPWNLAGSMATHRYNTVADKLPDYDNSPIHWTADARQYLDSLPAFTRLGTFNYMNALAEASHANQVHAADLDRLFLQRFGYKPEPLSEFAFISLKGPFDFVLANHRDSTGGFTREVLQNPNDAPGANPSVSLSRPDHLRLFNHGYEVGWRMIRADVPGWLRLLGRKLTIFAEGTTLGLTAYNLPYGREGVRRPIDLLTPFQDTVAGPIYRIIFVGLLCIGALRTLTLPKPQRGFAALCLLVIMYKVLVTMAFYGYARQAVSIAPAFFIFVSLGIAWLMPFMPDLTYRRIVPIGIAIAALLFLIDVHAAFNHELPDIRPKQDLAPQWGENAFQTFERIELHR